MSRRFELLTENPYAMAVLRAYAGDASKLSGDFQHTDPGNWRSCRVARLRKLERYFRRARGARQERISDVRMIVGRAIYTGRAYLPEAPYPC